MLSPAAGFTSALSRIRSERRGRPRASLTACLAALAIVLAIGSLPAQEAQFGVAMPLEIAGGILDTGRAQADSTSAPRWTAGFQVLAKPELKLGSHWYAYSAIQVRSTPFFYQDAFSADRSVETQLLQGFLGYTRSWRQTTISARAGQLSTAFGSFPLRYDDMLNPLLDQPLAYNYLDLPFEIAGGEEYGIQPATLYGLPGAEVDLSWRRIDGRLQVTNSSPANPKGLLSSHQHAQWTAGGGYTLWQGFRVGVSAFRGPWLDDAASEYLPPGASLASFQASGLGVDAQWARGHWSANGEWDRFVFNYPYYSTPPASNFGYTEVKRILGPRWYAAVRANYESNNHTVFWDKWSSATYLPNRQAYEAAIGFRPDRLQLLKVGYEWVNVHGGPRAQDNVFGIQFITSVNSLSKAFK